MLNTEMLRELRHKQNMTLNDIAKRVGYQSINGYWAIEIGLVSPTIDRAENIAKALGTTLYDLLL